MKKLTIGALVGGLLIFIWQTLSWTVLNLHHANQEYAANQDSILHYLNSQFSEDGSYLLPNSPREASRADMEKQFESNKSKPWVEIQYHKAQTTQMGANIFRSLLNDIVTVGLLCWILMRLSPQAFGTLFGACLLTGLIIFLNAAYSIHIWYPKRDIMAHLADSVMSWAICGIWLAWWLRRKLT